MSSGSLKLFVDPTHPLETRISMGSLGDVKIQLPEVQLLAIYLVSGLLIHVIFSMVFFPFEKYGKELILCCEDLDHIASNVFLKQSHAGGQPGVPPWPDSPMDPGVGPIMAHVQGGPQGSK